MLRRKSRDQLWEERLADLKKEHNRLVDALTAWIEQLQAQQGAMPTASPMMRGVAAAPPAEMEVAAYMSDEEEDLREAHRVKLITDAQLNEALEQLRFMNTDVIAS